MGIEATRVTVKEVMDEVNGEVQAIIPMNPSMENQLNRIKGKIAGNMPSRLKDICAFFELKEASSNIKSKEFGTVRNIAREIRNALQNDIRDFKKNHTQKSEITYVGEPKLTFDDPGKLSKPANHPLTHRNENEVALHMAVSQHLKAMDQLKPHLADLKNEETAYLMSMQDDVHTGASDDPFNDPVNGPAIMQLMQQLSDEHDFNLQSGAAIQPQTIPASQPDQKADTALKEKTEDKATDAVEKQPEVLPQEQKTDSGVSFDPMDDPENSFAIMQAIQEMAMEADLADSQSVQSSSQPVQTPATDNNTVKPAVIQEQPKLSNVQQPAEKTDAKGGGYVLGTGEKVVSSESEKPQIQDTANTTDNTQVQTAQSTKATNKKFMSFSDLVGTGSSSSKSSRKKDPMEDLKGLENIHSFLTGNGFKLYYVSGEGAHCGSRSLMIALIAHFKSLETDAGDTFLSNMKGVMKKADDRVRMDSMFRAAKRDMTNALQVGHSDGLDIVRLRLPGEKPSFMFGRHNDFATDGERLIKTFLTDLANSGRLDKTSKDDLLRSISSPSAYMLAETIAKVMSAVEAHTGIATQNNGEFWQFGENLEVDKSFMQVVPYQFSGVVARMAHAHFVAYAK